MGIRPTTSRAALAAAFFLALAGLLACTSSSSGLMGNGSSGAPAITQQPSSQATTVGRSATFTVAASGATTFQWQAGTTDIAGATSASYTLQSAASAQNGATYRAVATNANGSTTSNSATLTVNPLPTFTVQPAGQTITAPGPVTFTATATGGTPPLTYQWMLNGTPIAGATSSSYSLAATSTTDNGAVFTAVATDAAGATATSAPATLNIGNGAAPTITLQPTNQATTVGFSATFTVAATGATSYKWQSGTTDIPGATSASYTVQGATGTQNGATFRAIATNAAGSTTSSSASLTVNLAPSFTTQPAGFTALIPGSATFSGIATGGTAPLAYQWQRNGTTIPGATAASYTLPATASADNGAVFTLVASDAVGASATSAPATLQAVTLPASFTSKAMLRPILPVAPADSAQVQSLQAQLIAKGLTLSSDGSLIAWPESPAAGWRVDFGAQHTLIDVDGTFTLNSPTDGAQFATFTHPSDPQTTTQVPLAQLASIVGSAAKLVIAQPFHGPCGMTTGDNLACAAPTLSPLSALAFRTDEERSQSLAKSQSCAGCPPKPQSRMGEAPLVSPNTTCSPTLNAFNNPRQIVYTPSPDGIRGSYPNPAVPIGSIGHCVISDGYITNPSVDYFVRYLGSTCDVYVLAGTCPNENAFSDTEYAALYAANLYDQVKKYFTGPGDIYAPLPKSRPNGDLIHCVQNHKRRNCAMVCLGDLSLDFTVDQHIVHAGESYTTYIPYGGTPEPFVVHNNGVYGITEIVKVKDDIGGILNGAGVVYSGVDQEVHHFRPTSYVAVNQNTPDPTAYNVDESVTYTPYAGAAPGTQAIYKFMVDNQKVTITFIIGPY